MKRGLLKSLMTAMAVIVGLSFSTSFAQNFVSESGSAYNASCRGVIKIKALTGTFTNNGTANQGTVANPIDGTVDYAAAANGQDVQGFYYTTLVLSGGAKNVLTDVRISGEACATALGDYAQLENYPFYETVVGNVTYNGTFYYIGTGPGSQSIYPQYNIAGGQPNNYNILNLTGGGDKDIRAGDVIGATTITSDLGTDLAVSGILNVGNGPSTLTGNTSLDVAAAEINVNNGDVTFVGNLTVTAGTLAVVGTGDAIIGAGSTLDLVGNTSIVELGPNTDLIITGLINNGGDGNNIDFDCTSEITYNGTQNPQLIMPTIATGSYGNLTMVGGAKRADVEAYGSDLYLCTNLALTGGNLDMVTNTGTLHMTNLAGTATYGAGGNGDEEVAGNFNRTVSNAAGTFTYNNRLTTVTLGVDADNPTSLTMYVNKGENPNNYVAGTDLNRKITMSYAGGTGLAFSTQLSVGYSYDDRPNWTAPNTQTTVRMYESDVAGIGVEKIGTGAVPARGAATGPSGLGFVSMAGIQRGAGAVPNNIGDFASGNDVLLRTGPTTFYTIADGRWSNPNVWDEGTTPSAIDDAGLRHTIYVGIDGPFVNTTGGADETQVNNTYRESTLYPGGIAAANKITIMDPIASSRPALVMGNEDNGAGWIFKTASLTAPSFVITNTGTPDITLSTIAAKATYATTPSPFNGLWLTSYSAANNPDLWFPTLSTQQIQNSGTVNNEGVIELGE